MNSFGEGPKRDHGQEGKGHQDERDPDHHSDELGSMGRQRPDDVDVTHRPSTNFTTRPNRAKIATVSRRYTTTDMSSPFADIKQMPGSLSRQRPPGPRSQGPEEKLAPQKGAEAFLYDFHTLRAGGTYGHCSQNARGRPRYRQHDVNRDWSAVAIL